MSQNKNGEKSGGSLYRELLEGALSKFLDLVLVSKVD